MAPTMIIKNRGDLTLSGGQKNGEKFLGQIFNVIHKLHFKGFFGDSVWGLQPMHE